METLFRAKKINSSERAIGFLNPKAKPNLTHSPYEEDWLSYTIEDDIGIWEIDPSTRSIHYSTMTDMEDNKVFASLDEDGLGGDIVEDEDGIRYVCLILNNSLCFIDLEDGYLIDDKHSTDWVKVVGIKDE